MNVILLATCSIATLFGGSADAADRIIIGNVSRTVEQLPNYAATDRAFSTRKTFEAMSCRSVPPTR